MAATGGGADHPRRRRGAIDIRLGGAGFRARVPVGIDLAVMGNSAAAIPEFDQATSALGRGGCILARVYAGLGDKPRALDALERAYAERIVDLNFMAVDPMLASLRAEPRFVALKSRIEL
jgi:hypothetical protein